MGFELTTSTLARLHSTPELHRIQKTATFYMWVTGEGKRSLSLRANPSSILPYHVGDKVVYAVFISVMAEKIAGSTWPPYADKAVTPIGRSRFLRKGIQTTNSQSRSNSR